jgi:hypothetical protein
MARKKDVVVNWNVPDRSKLPKKVEELFCSDVVAVIWLASQPTATTVRSTARVSSKNGTYLRFLTKRILKKVSDVKSGYQL